MESEVHMLVVNETNDHQHLDFDSIEDSTLTWFITYDLLATLSSASHIVHEQKKHHKYKLMYLKTTRYDVITRKKWKVKIFSITLIYYEIEYYQIKQACTLVGGTLTQAILKWIQQTIKISSHS